MKQISPLVPSALLSTYVFPFFFLPSTRTFLRLSTDGSTSLLPGLLRRFLATELLIFLLSSSSSSFFFSLSLFFFSSFWPSFSGSSSYFPLSLRRLNTLRSLEAAASQDPVDLFAASLLPVQSSSRTSNVEPCYTVGHWIQLRNLRSVPVRSIVPKYSTLNTAARYARGTASGTLLDFETVPSGTEETNLSVVVSSNRDRSRSFRGISRTFVRSVGPKLFFRNSVETSETGYETPRCIINAIYFSGGL